MVFVTERTSSESKKMSAQSDSLEIVHEGWLTKSPPTKSIWRAVSVQYFYLLKLELCSYFSKKPYISYVGISMQG